MGYVACLSTHDKELFPYARFGDLSQEIAIARLQLWTVVARGGTARDVLPLLDSIAKLVKLRHQLDATR